MSKPAVLCINRSYIESMEEDGTDMDIGSVPISEASFIPRSIVDAQDPTVGREFPQIIPCIVMQNEKGEYLTYPRTGSETRLHDKYSITIGGHIDITDLPYTYEDWLSETVCSAAVREVDEEIGLDVHISPDMFKHMINLPDGDEVSQVHVGLVAVLRVKAQDVLESDEITDIVWQNETQLKNNLQSFELWGQHIINKVINNVT